MISQWLTNDCVFALLTRCDIATIEVLRHVPELISVHLLDYYSQFTFVPRHVGMCNYAAHRGYFNLLKWAISNGYYFDQSVYESAASGGQLDILKWVTEQLAASSVYTWYDVASDTHSVYSAAARGGHLETLKWMYENGQYSDGGTRVAAAAGGHVHVLEWLSERRYDITAPVFDMCSGAARGGHVSVLKWMNEDGYDTVNFATFTTAAREGHISVLKWLLDNGGSSYTADMSVCSSAATGGQLNTLKWLRENKFEWNADTCAYAAAKGHLSVLEWAMANWCDSDDRMCIYAASNGHLNVLKWIEDNANSELSSYSHGVQVFIIAAEKGQLSVVKWIVEHRPRDFTHEHNAVLSNLCTYAAFGGHLELLKWAISYGCEWEPKTYMYALSRGYYDILEWLGVDSTQEYVEAA